MAYDDDDDDPSLTELNLGPWAPKVPTIVWSSDKYRIVCHWKSVKFEESSTDAMNQVSWSSVSSGNRVKVLWLVLTKVAMDHMSELDSKKNTYCEPEDVNYVNPEAGCLPPQVSTPAPGSVPDDDIPF